MKDEVLSAKLSRREEEVIAWCIRRYSRLLWPIVSAVLCSVGSEADVEECVADVFISLWEHPHQFDPKRGSLKSYLCTLARSRAIDRYRQLARHSTIPLEEAVLTAEFHTEQSFLRQETQHELQAAIQALGQPARDILIRRYYYGQKPRDIALAMDLTVKQVDNALYRAKRQLRGFLTGIGGNT